MNQFFGTEAFKVDSARSDDERADRLQLYDQAASLVSAGAWSCELSSERLVWTSGVFDLFGLAGAHTPERHEVVEMYSEESRDLLERKRSHAIHSAAALPT